MRRNIHFRPSRGQSILSGLLACAMGAFGLFTIPNAGAFLAFKALWCLMTFGMAIYSFLLAAGKVRYGGFEITDETDGDKKSAPSDEEARLTKLRELYDRGLITEEEYQEKKKDILDRL